MTKANVGHSIAANPFQAGQEAATAAAAGLSEIKMAFIYSSVDYDQTQVLKGAAAALPGVPLVGNTSFTGIITPEGFISGAQGFVGIMALAGQDLTVGTAALPKQQSPRETGIAVAKKALAAAGRNTAPDYFYMAANPGEEEYFLKGITDVIGRVPFFGGSAADNSISGQWLLLSSDGGAFAEGVVVAFFYSDKPFANKFTGAYHETNHCGIITKLEGDRTLVEINGQPALKQYAEWTGVQPETLLGSALLAASITAPLGVKDRLGDLVAIRHPMNGNPDASMNLGNNLAVNTALIQMAATVDELIDSTGTTLAQLKAKLAAPAAGYHLVHCGGRRAGIDRRIDEVAQQLIKEAAGVPFIAEFTFGEYGYEDDGNNTCGGLMLSFTGFGE